MLIFIVLVNLEKYEDGNLYVCDWSGCKNDYKGHLVEYNYIKNSDIQIQMIIKFGTG